MFRSFRILYFMISLESGTAWKAALSSQRFFDSLIVAFAKFTCVPMAYTCQRTKMPVMSPDIFDLSSYTELWIQSFKVSMRPSDQDHDISYGNVIQPFHVPLSESSDMAQIAVAGR